MYMMSPRTKQTTATKSHISHRTSRTSGSQHTLRSDPGTSLVPSTSITSEMSEFSSRSGSETSSSDDVLMWDTSLTGQLQSHDDDVHFDSLRLDTMTLSNNAFAMPILSGSRFYDAPLNHFPQDSMSQTLAGPLMEPSYQGGLLADDLLSDSSVNLDYTGCIHNSHHTWRHGQLSPPAEIFHPDMNDYPMDPACDVAFQTLPEPATTEALVYQAGVTSAPKQGVPRPIRSALEKNALSRATMAPQDIHYARSDRADKVKARNDPRYDAGPDTHGYYHCPMLFEGTCNHKPTKQKCIYAKYLDSHLKPYVCTHGEKGSECDGARFSSNACLFRHEREAHGMHNHGLNPYLCLFPGCERSRQGNGFPRRWNQRDHMKRVHEWEEPETSPYDSQDRSGPIETTRRKKAGNSSTTQIKRANSSHSRTHGVAHPRSSRHSVDMSRYTAHADNELPTHIMYPAQYDDLQYPHDQLYYQQPGTSGPYQDSYLVAY